jgi:hypothetical protein
MRVTVLSMPPSQVVMDTICEVIEMKIVKGGSKYASLGPMSSDQLIEKVFVDDMPDPVPWTSFFKEHFSTFQTVLTSRQIIGMTQEGLFYVAPEAHGRYIERVVKVGEAEQIEYEYLLRTEEPAEISSHEPARTRAWRWFTKLIRKKT